MRGIYVLIGIFFLLVVGYNFYPAQEVPVQSHAEIRVEPKPAVNPAEEQYVFVQQDNDPYVQKLLIDYQHYIDESIHKGVAPGAAVAVVKNSQVIYLKGFGLR